MSHRAEGDDLRDLVSAIFVRAIFQHFRAAVIAEVQVNIGHRDTPGVEEAFKDKGMFERVNQRNVQCVGDDRTSRRTARVVPDPIFTGEAAQVPDDQEVGIESHLVDDAQFIIESFLDLWAGGVILVTFLRPFLTQVSADRFLPCTLPGRGTQADDSP